MKRNIYFVSALVLLIAVLLFLKFGLRSHMTAPDAASASNKVPSTNAASQKAGVAVASPSPGIRSPNDAAVLARIAAFQAVWADANSRSLDFYARVIDQNGQPIVGAKITGFVMTTVGFDGTRETPHYTQTDSSGNFQFSGLHGQCLGIIPEKAGYEFNRRTPDSWTEDYKASPNNRVTIPMWKLKGPEPMIHSAIDGRVPCDGSTAEYNLQGGYRVHSGGDLIVQLTRSPLNIDQNKHFDWSVTFSIPSGGLIEEHDEYPNEAPEDGYESSVTINMPASATNWSASLTRSYYFKSHNGQDYGRMTIEIQGVYQPPPEYFGADIYINPAGSRNLEFDPSKQINP